MNNLTSSQNHSTLFKELEKLKQSFSFEKEEDEQKFYKKQSNYCVEIPFETDAIHDIKNNFLYDNDEL